MRCAILAIGSRGDVQPLVALGAGLRDAGVSVRIATHADFEAMVRRAGLDFHPLVGSAAAFYGGAGGIALRERTRDAASFLRFFDSYLALFLEKLLAGAWEAARDADVVLSWPWTRFGPSLAERLRVPVFIASVSPVWHLPTAAFPNPFQDAPGDTPRRSWRHALPATRIGQAQVDRWRRETLGLGPMTWRQDLRALRRLPHLFGCSPAVFPKPADWGPHVHMTGYWFLDEPARFDPPPALAAFLAGGSTPIAIGFSSQVGKDAARLTRTVADAVALSGQRAVLVTGFGGLKKGIDLPDAICPVETVPYDWLFPRVSAMAHQGGAGSTAAALRFGLPNFAVTFGYEQTFWGARLAALGAGPEPIDAATMTAGALADRLTRAATDAEMRARAAEVSAAIRAEDGIRRAVDLILEAADRPR